MSHSESCFHFDGDAGKRAFQQQIATGLELGDLEPNIVYVAICTSKADLSHYLGLPDHILR